MRSMRPWACAVACLLTLGLVGCERDNEDMIKRTGPAAGKPAPGASSRSEDARSTATSPMNSDPSYLKK